MTATPAPRVTRARGFSLVWVVPLLALAVGGWMISRELSQRGPEIAIEFAEGSGLEANKTVLEHKGVTIGVVKSVELKPDRNGVVVRLRLDRSAAAVATEDAQFWVVRPEIGLSGVRGLDLLLSGARLAVRPGKGALATQFKGLDKVPIREELEEGRAFVIEAEQLGSLNPGAPVFYREFKVGRVETSRLSADATRVLIRLRILKPYANLVRENSRFWNAGGVSMRVNLLGAQVKSTSLESIFAGGVAFASPDGKAFGDPAPDGMRFTLHAEPEKDWLRWQPTIQIESEDASPDATSGNTAAIMEQAMKR